MKLVYITKWLQNLYKSYSVQTRVKLIGEIAYSQGRRANEENRVLIETYEDGQTRVTFIYDESFDFENGRMEIHKREGTLPEIKDEASCGIYFKGFNGPLTGVSLLVKNHPAFYFKLGGDGWTGKWADGKTTGLITSSCFYEGAKSNYYELA